MNVLAIVSIVFLLCLNLVVIHTPAASSPATLDAAEISQQHLDHEEKQQASDNAQAQLRASIHTTSGTRRLGARFAAAQAHPLKALIPQRHPAPPGTG